ARKEDYVGEWVPDADATVDYVRQHVALLVVPAEDLPLMALEGGDTRSIREAVSSSQVSLRVTSEDIKFFDRRHPGDNIVATSIRTKNDCLVADVDDHSFVGNTLILRTWKTCLVMDGPIPVVFRKGAVSSMDK
ncbi:MAG: hypothetical protein Q8L55_02335, partial [Phycisphaerales bacterium]|nr:hypothetical protein [Phycisphaerales bacterium]